MNGLLSVLYDSTPLIGAAEKGNAQLCQFLLDNGADPRVINNDGRLYFRRYTFFCNFVANLNLYNIGFYFVFAHYLTYVCGCSGKTAWQYAVDKSYIDVQKVLVEALSNPQSECLH